MPRAKHKYFIIYKTTNLINNKYYIGMHSTSDLEDGYLGSGKRLRRSLIKYGKENFKFEILEYLNNIDLLANRESEIVNIELIKDPLCMNLKPGGSGGFVNEEHKQKWIKAGNDAAVKKFNKRFNTDIEFKNEMINKAKNIVVISKRKGTFKKPPIFNKSHSEETIKLMKDKKINHGVGEANSQYGTCWITKEEINKKIKKEELDLYLTLGWSKGRI